MLDGPVFPGGIEGLKNDEERIRVRRVEDILELRHARDIGSQFFLGGLLVREIPFVRGVEIAQFDFLARLDAEVANFHVARVNPAPGSCKRRFRRPISRE